MRLIASVASLGLILAALCPIAWGQGSARGCEIDPRLPDVGLLPRWEAAFLGKTDANRALFFDSDEKQVVLSIPSGDVRNGYPPEPYIARFPVSFHLCLETGLLIQRVESSGGQQVVLRYSYRIENSSQSWVPFNVLELFTERKAGESVRVIGDGWKGAWYLPPPRKYCWNSPQRRNRLYVLTDDDGGLKPGSTIDLSISFESALLPGPVCMAFSGYASRIATRTEMPDAITNAPFSREYFGQGPLKNSRITFGPMLDSSSDLPTRADAWLRALRDFTPWHRSKFSKPFLTALEANLSSLQQGATLPNLAKSKCWRDPIIESLSSLSTNETDLVALEAFKLTFPCGIE